MYYLLISKIKKKKKNIIKTECVFTDIYTNAYDTYPYMLNGQ